MIHGARHHPSIETESTKTTTTTENPKHTENETTTAKRPLTIHTQCSITTNRGTSINRYHERLLGAASKQKATPSRHETRKLKDGGTATVKIYKKGLGGCVREAPTGGKPGRQLKIVVIPLSC